MVHLVHPGNRSAYVVAEDDGTMYLRSHTFLRLRQPVDPAIDAATSADPGSVSSTSDDTAPGPVTCSRAVANTSIMRHSYGKAPTSEPDSPTHSVLHRGTWSVHLREGPEEEG